MDRDEKLYFSKGMSFNELLEVISCNDIQFYYKNRAYNITMHSSPCITVLDEGDEVWEKCMKNYKTYDLTVVDTADVLMGSGSNYYFKKAGTYDLTVNLKTFEISAELLPE